MTESIDEDDETLDWAAADGTPEAYLDDDAVGAMTLPVADGTQVPATEPAGWAASVASGGAS